MKEAMIAWYRDTKMVDAVNRCMDAICASVFPKMAQNIFLLVWIRPFVPAIRLLLKIRNSTLPM